MKTKLILSAFCLIFSCVGLVWLAMIFVLTPPFVGKIEFINEYEKPITISVL